MERMAMPASSKVRVAVRLKPESARGRKCAFLNGTSAVIVGDKTFQYDHVYGENCTQQNIYEHSVAPLVMGCFRGFNATVFAYGQTGSGKTHSIVGIPRCIEDEGIIPRALRQIFEYFRADKTGRVVSMHISFLEIYNDECRDLLHPDIPSRDIMIREDKEGRIFFTGAREEVVTSVEDSLYYLERGNLSRTTAETFMNATSSRSHAIFSIALELFEYASAATSEGAENTYIQSKLHLVDLAGSERAKRTGAEGVRLKESVGINQGLLALGKVIRALTAPKNGSQQAAHVPYRESKLTRFLQDSLGGNSRTIMLACVSPADINMHETLSTLQYASRARIIQNKAVANVSVGLHSLPEVDGSLVGALRTQLQLMQAELEQYKSGQQRAGATGSLRPPLDVRGSHALPASSPRKSVGSALVEDIVRVAAEAQCALRDAYDSLGSAATNPQACGLAWQVVQACGEASLALEDILENTKQMRNLRQSLSDKGGLPGLPGAHDDEVRQLRAELDECREDLKRDEDIFAEKVRELKRCRKQIRELQQENSELTGRLTDAQQTVDQQRRLIDAQRPRGAPSLDAQSKRYEEEDEDDLELSIAVAASEPDISQLMEDLEAVSREKEKLVTDRNIAESKEEHVARAAEQQREEFKRGQEALQRRLKELEINIRLKQELIADLTRGQNEATQLAERHEARVLLLEEESAQLQDQLDKLNRARRLTYEEAEEERARRIELEGKLAEAQEYLADMEAQRKKQEKRWKAEKEAEERRKLDAKKTEEHLAELTSLQSSYAKLSAQLEHDEHKHRKDLDALSSQVAAFKRSSGEAQQLIKHLEQKNADLRVRLERSAKAMGRSASAPRPQSSSSSSSSVAPPLPGSAAGRSRPREAKSLTSSSPARDDASVMTEHTSHTNHTAQTNQSARSGAGSVSTAATAATTSTRRGKKVAIDWLLQRVDDFTAARYAKVEVAKLLSNCRAAEREKSDLQGELKQLQAQQRDGEAALTKQMREVESRLDKLVQLSKQYKAEAAALASAGDEVRRQATLAKLADTERALRSHMEHRTELSHRLGHGVLGTDALSRLQDIRDELETLETEISLNVVRLGEEKRRINKARKDGAGAGAGAGAEELVEHVLMREMEAIAGQMQDVGEHERGLYAALSQIAQTLVDTKYRCVRRETVNLFMKCCALSDPIPFVLSRALLPPTPRLTRTLTYPHDSLRAGVDSAAVQALQAKLDDQQSECEELVNAMHKARGDSLRKAEQQRLEYEDKIAFLLQQLRNSESKLMDTSGSLRRSQALQLAAEDAEYASARPLPRPGAVRSSTGTSASTSSTNQSLLSTSGHGWRKSDAQLSAYVSQLQGQGSASAPADIEALECQKEVVRRWLSEKERREALEKKNGELLRELRKLKA